MRKGKHTYSLSGDGVFIVTEVSFGCMLTILSKGLLPRLHPRIGKRPPESGEKGTELKSGQI